ncbi:hypothetical protein GCM10027570_33220 [Streptomonospora sediminis]
MSRRANAWLCGIAGALMAALAVVMIVLAATRGEAAVAMIGVFMLVPAYLIVRSGQTRASTRRRD